MVTCPIVNSERNSSATLIVAIKVNRLAKDTELELDILKKPCNLNDYKASKFGVGDKVCALYTSTNLVFRQASTDNNYSGYEQRIPDSLNEGSCAFLSFR